MSSLLHISSNKKGKIDEPSINIKNLTNGQKRRLQRYCCYLCEMSLYNIEYCGICLGKPCSQSTRNKRVKDCLKEYKPRKKNE